MEAMRVQPEAVHSVAVWIKQKLKCKGVGVSFEWSHRTGKLDSVEFNIAGSGRLPVSVGEFVVFRDGTLHVMDDEELSKASPNAYVEAVCRRCEDATKAKARVRSFYEFAIGTRSPMMAGDAPGAGGTKLKQADVEKAARLLKEIEELSSEREAMKHATDFSVRAYVDGGGVGKKDVALNHGQTWGEVASNRAAMEIRAALEKCYGGMIAGLYLELERMGVDVDFDTSAVRAEAADVNS